MLGLPSKARRGGLTRRDDRTKSYARKLHQGSEEEHGVHVTNLQAKLLGEGLLELTFELGIVLRPLTERSPVTWTQRSDAPN